MPGDKWFDRRETRPFVHWTLGKQPTHTMQFFASKPCVQGALRVDSGWTLCVNCCSAYERVEELDCSMFEDDLSLACVPWPELVHLDN